MTQEPHKDSLATRRGMLAGVGLVGLAGAITACGASGSSSSSAAAGAATTSAPTGAGAGSSSSAASGGGASASGGTASSALTATSEIPVGSGKIFPAKHVVVTQPTAGEYKAFSATCTHMGCTVSTISAGDIICPCHGSHYSIKNGSVVSGPAPKPLPAEKIKVTGGKIFLE